MRRAELAGLRWSDIDFTRARLTPRLPRVAVNYQVHESDTKTPSGRRPRPRPGHPRGAGRASATPSRGARGHRTRRHQRPGVHLAGRTALHPDLITDWFQRHAKRVVWEQDGRTKVGLPPIRLHDVRHSYATAALAAGIPAKIVSERLGHANVQITLDTYSHVIPGLDEQAAATVARLILEAQRPLPWARPAAMLPILLPNGRRPPLREEVRGEVPGELGGGGGI